MRVCKREHDLVGEVGDGGGEKSKGLAEDRGGPDEAGQRGEARTQGLTMQDFEKFHLHAKSLKCLTKEEEYNQICIVKDRSGCSGGWAGGPRACPSPGRHRA